MSDFEQPVHIRVRRAVKKSGHVVPDPEVLFGEAARGSMQPQIVDLPVAGLRRWLEKGETRSTQRFSERYRPALRAGTIPLIAVLLASLAQFNLIANRSAGEPGTTRSITGAVAASTPSPRAVMSDVSGSIRFLTPSSFGRARLLMADGDLAGARRLLGRVAASGSPQAAFALGRTYDSKFVSGLAAGDTRPDDDRARHWYREWYRRSVEKGILRAGLDLDRLLLALDGKQVTR